MGKEVNLLKNYPRSNRSDQLDQRIIGKTNHDKEVAQKFGKEFFDGDRKYGYGGFAYDSKYWQPVIPSFKKHYNLDNSSNVICSFCFSNLIAYLTCSFVIL